MTTLHPLSMALVHYPVRDRVGDIVTTAITNLDVHDIARSAKTYGLARYYIVTPVAAQQQLAQGILEHWKRPESEARLAARTRALSCAQVAESIEAAVAHMRETLGLAPAVVATSAQRHALRPGCSFAEVAALRRERPVLLLFGTGHGLADEALLQSECILEAIDPGSGYLHLSVRAAVAIILDRLHCAASAD